MKATLGVPDIIVTETRLARIDGYELCAESGMMSPGWLRLNAASADDEHNSKLVEQMVPTPEGR